MTGAQVCRPRCIWWLPYCLEIGCAAQEFLIYVLAAFLLTWSEPLRTMEFQDLVMYLQANAHAFCVGLSWFVSEPRCSLSSTECSKHSMTGVLGMVKLSQQALS